MRVRIIVENEEGHVWAETSRLLDEGVHFDGKKYSKILIHPMEDNLVYETLNQAQDNINNWDNPKF